MRFARIVPALTLAARVTAQSTFEPQDFNVTAALENIGVDVATLPEPEEANYETPTRAKRSLEGLCSLAVSRTEQSCMCKTVNATNANHQLSVPR